MMVNRMPYGKEKLIKFRKLNVGDTFKFVYNDSIFIKVSANRYKLNKGGGAKKLIKNRSEFVILDKKVQLTDTEISDWRKNGVLLRKL